MSIRERRERERAERHQRIVATARDLAEREGWDAVTTRRLAELIEYSQPVLYSHFENKDAIVAAVAVEGFAELAADMRAATKRSRRPDAALRALARAYVRFGIDKPALYDAMFALASLPFARPEAPAPLHDAFRTIRDTVFALEPRRDPDLLAEVTWAALHGEVTLKRAGRLRSDLDDARLAMLSDLVIDAAASKR